jgi:trehalose 2-sulfotransferase
VSRSTEVTASCVIGALPRSGSWLLAEALNNTGLAGQPEEYFRPDITHVWSRLWGLAPRGPYGRYIEAAIGFSRTANGVFSVKLHWYQFAWLLEQMRILEGEASSKTDPELVAKWLPKPRYLLLLRRDTARQAISYFRAAQSQVWFVTEEDAAPAAADEEREPDFQSIRWLEDVLVEHEACWRNFFECNEIQPLEIVYEDFVANYDATVRKVLDFLDIRLPDDFEVAPPGLIKQAGEQSELLLAEYLAKRDTISARPDHVIWSREMRRYVHPEDLAT